MLRPPHTYVGGTVTPSLVPEREDRDNHLSGVITVKFCTAAHLAPFFANEVIIRWIVRGGLHGRYPLDSSQSAAPPG